MRRLSGSTAGNKLSLSAEVNGNRTFYCFQAVSLGVFMRILHENPRKLF